MAIRLSRRIRPRPFRSRRSGGPAGLVVPVASRRPRRRRPQPTLRCTRRRVVSSSSRSGPAERRARREVQPGPGRPRRQAEGRAPPPRAPRPRRRPTTSRPCHAFGATIGAQYAGGSLSHRRPAQQRQRPELPRRAADPGRVEPAAVATPWALSRPTRSTAGAAASTADTPPPPPRSRRSRSPAARPPCRSRSPRSRLAWPP